MVKKLLIIGSALVLLLVAYFGVSTYLNSRVTAQDAVNTFFGKIQKGDATTTYAQFTPDLQTRVSKDQWQQIVAYFKGYSGPKVLHSQSSIVNSRYPAKSKARNFVYFLKPNGYGFQMSITVFKQGNTWKIGDTWGEGFQWDN